MSWMNEAGTALKVTVQVAGQGSFWRAMLRALLGPALLVVAAVLIALYLMVDTMSILARGLAPSNIAAGLALLACMLLMGPLLMRAWCPPAARAVAEAMQLDLPELPVPSLASFIGAWLVVAIAGLALLVATFFIPRPFGWLMMLPAALLFSSYQVRCALCLHADAKERQSVVAHTMSRRVLLWFPLCGLPLYLDQLGVASVKSLFISPYDFTVSMASRMFDVMGVLVSLAVLALVLVLWAAFSLQALNERLTQATLTGRPARRTATPAPVAQIRTAAPAAAPVPLPPSAPAPRAPNRTVPRNPPPVGKWIGVTLGILLCAGAIAYVAREPLMHKYLAWTDEDYAMEAFLRRDSTTAEVLATAYVAAGCSGDLPRIKLLMRMHIAATPDTLGTALACAAKYGKMSTAVFLIGKKANVNAIPAERSGRRHQPVTPLQYAVASQNQPLVDLLLSKGADVALQADGSPGALHFAARNMDTGMIALLIKAGARPDAPAPQAPIFYFLEKAFEGQRDTSAPGWAAVIAKAERAGLSTGGVNADGGNLLHWAAARGELGLIEVLLARGLDRHQQDKSGAMPFMQLANWYHHTGTEPGAELEFMLKALTSGVQDINMASDLRVATRSPGVDGGWTLARAAAAKQRVRAVFGERISYAMLSPQQWSLQGREQAVLLIADLSAEQIAGAPALGQALRNKGWEDLAVQVEAKR